MGKEPPPPADRAAYHALTRRFAQMMEARLQEGHRRDGWRGVREEHLALQALRKVGEFIDERLALDDADLDDAAAESEMAVRQARMERLAVDAAVYMLLAADSAQPLITSDDYLRPPPDNRWGPGRLIAVEQEVRRCRAELTTARRLLAAARSRLRMSNRPCHQAPLPPLSPTGPGKRTRRR